MRHTDEQNQPKGTGRAGFFPGLITGALLGIGSTLTYQFLSQILKQPRLTTKAVLADLRDFDTDETRALFIATESLLAGLTERHLSTQEHRLILHAGYRNFRESWARDFGFASYGLLALNKYRPVKETLEAFFWFQKTDGQLPVKLRSMNVVSRFFHSILEREQSLDAHLTPKYVSGHRSYSFDGQSLLVIAASKYIRESGDRAFAEHFWGKMQAAMNWLKSQRRKGMHLLSQSPYADWADSVARKGVVCYTNIVYWKALMEMAVSAQFLARRGEAYLYQESAAVVKAELQDVLWQPDRGYFATSPSMSNLSSGGNLLAIAWGLANQRQSESILNRMRDYGMAYPVPTQAAYPPYQRSKISIENRLGRIANYHTDGAWLWLGAWHIIALCKTGRNDRAQRLLARLAKIILRDQQIYEVYGLDSRPLSSIFYTAESPLTWNAGMLVYAYHILEQHLQIPSLVTK